MLHDWKRLSIPGTFIDPCTIGDILVQRDHFGIHILAKLKLSAFNMKYNSYWIHIIYGLISRSFGIPTLKSSIIHQREEWGRWTTRQVEPGGVEEWGGIEFFFFQQAGRDWKLSILQTAFNLAARWFVQWNKHWQLIASERESDQLGLVDGKTFGDEMRASTISLSLLNLCSFSFHDYRQCLIRNRLVWKCSPNVNKLFRYKRCLWQQ